MSILGFMGVVFVFVMKKAKKMRPGVTEPHYMRRLHRRMR